MQPLNSPIETGTRALVVLDSVAPQSCDIDHLVFLDYTLIHSADFGGPVSLHPSIPIRQGELGAKKQSLELGLQVMLRAGLAEVEFSPAGIRYRASEEAYSFLRLLESPYLQLLLDRAGWVVEAIEGSEEGLANRMRDLIGGVLGATDG